ncbi:MAG: DUF5668 domain-containing protein [Trueperaceae bacterium]|nr:DUF5668 domain-containing protein [Trueperaceae bacterium]
MNETDSTRNDKSPSLLLPVLLIIVGVLLLLGRVGWFDWNLVLAAVDLWPLLLIAVGADILTRGRYRLAVVVATVVVGAVLIRVPGVWPSTGGPAEVHPISHPLNGASVVELDVDHGVGVLSLDALPAGNELAIEGEVATAAGERLLQSFDVSGGTARIGLESRTRGPNFGARGGDRRWTLDLTREVPLRLDLDTGVGESTLTLRALQLQAIDLDAGVGRVDVVLPERGGYAGSIDAGVGEVVVRVPRSVEARFVVSTGLGGASVDGVWVRDGNVHTTPGYDQAAEADRIDVRVQGGVGEVRVQRVD